MPLRPFKTCLASLACLLPLTTAAQEATSQSQRNVLLEVFSTERCTNCPAGHETLERALGDKPNIIELVHHAGFFTDKFTIPESTKYEWFYKSDEYMSSFAPAFMTDRTHWDNLTDYYYYPNPMSMSFSSKALKAAYAEAVAVPALAEISITPAYDADTRLLSLDVEAEALVATEGYEHPALNVFLTENEVFSKTQENSFGSYYHKHMARQCLTTTWGEGFEAGGTISRHYEVPIPDDWNAENMSVVAFVANYNPSSNADCRVMNTEEAKLTGAEGIVDGVTLPTAQGSPSAIFNLQGQRVCPEHQPKGAIGTAGRSLQPGIYITNGHIIKL